MGGLVMLTLAACANQPTVVETPAIVWDPSAPASEDRFETAVREYHIGFAVAFNARDFTVEQLTSTTTAARIEASYEGFRSQYISAEADPRVYVGPMPYSVLDVMTHGADSATVVVCYAPTEWWIESDHPDPVVDQTADGQTATYRVGIDGGLLKVLDVSATVDPCEVGEIVFGRFDPAPELPESISERDIRPPLTIAP
jgi:hypothetical protein